MKKYLIAALLLACALPLRAQTADTQAADAQKKADAATAAKTEAAPKKAAKKHAKAAAQAQAGTAAAAAQPAGQTASDAAQPGAQPKAAKPAAKQADQDSDESVVMIDSKSDPEETGRFSAAQRGEPEDIVAPAGLPASYGQCKGVINEGGRSILVFESTEDGSITFVQVTPGKNSVSWRLVDRVQRSAE
jgi:hypothetical protein